MIRTFSTITITLFTLTPLMTIFSLGPLYIGTDPRYDLSMHLGNVVLQWDWSPKQHGPAKARTDRSKGTASVDIR